MQLIDVNHDLQKGGYVLSTLCFGVTIIFNLGFALRASLAGSTKKGLSEMESIETL